VRKCPPVGNVAWVSSMRPRIPTARSSIASLACAVVLCSPVLVGCGGSAASSTTTTQVARQTPIPPETVPAAGGAATGRRRNAPGAGLPSAVGAPGGRRIVNAPPQAPPLNPCTLVTGAQAQAIVGVSLVVEREAPLGPTCILEFRGHRAITIAIESLPFDSTVGEMAKRKRVAMAGFHADCGTQGTQMLYVSLGGGRVLNVTAPCAVARALAVKALGRLHV
jgi:hypothetical protein